MRFSKSLDYCSIRAVPLVTTSPFIRAVALVTTSPFIRVVALVTTLPFISGHDSTFMSAQYRSFKSTRRLDSIERANAELNGLSRRRGEGCGG